MTGDLLTDGERRMFARWLAERVALSGTGKMAIAKALGDDSTARLNRYIALDGTAQIPRAHILSKLCKTLDVSWVEAFWRAGYYSELLGCLDKIGRALLEERDFVSRSRPLRILVSEIVRLAIHAFPRRDIAPSRAVAELFEVLPDSILGTYSDIMLSLQALAPEDATGVANMSVGLAPTLTLAVDALRPHHIPTDTRRAIAGEYVNAWAETIASPGTIEAIRDDIRKRSAA